MTEFGEAAPAGAARGRAGTVMLAAAGVTLSAFALGIAFMMGVATAELRRPTTAPAGVSAGTDRVR